MSNQKNSYSLAMVPFVPWAVYNVAEKKGFWKQFGIDVKVVVHATENEYVTAVNRNYSDFYPLPLASTLDFINSGIDLVYLGILDLANGHKHLIRKSNHLNRSLRGQTVALYSDECTTRYLVARYLKTCGLTLADVNLITLDDQALVDGFINGNLELVLAFRGIKEKLRIEGDGTVVFTTANYPDIFGMTVNRQRLCAIPREDISAFYRGRFDALKWIGNPANWQEFRSIVNENTFMGLEEINDTDLRIQLDEVRVPESSALLTLNQETFREIFDDFKQVIVENRILNDLYYEKFTFARIIHNQELIETLKADNK